MSTETKTTTPRKKGKTAGNSSAVRNAKRAARRAEAEERNAHWAALRPEEQIISLAKRRGQSVRQVKRIIATR